MGDLQKDSIMTVMPNTELIDLTIDFLNSNCPVYKHDKKNKRKNQVRYPNTIIELDNDIVILEDCDIRLRDFNLINNYLKDNKIKLCVY